MTVKLEIFENEVCIASVHAGGTKFNLVVKVEGRRNRRIVCAACIKLTCPIGHKEFLYQEVKNVELRDRSEPTGYSECVDYAIGVGCDECFDCAVEARLASEYAADHPAFDNYSGKGIRCEADDCDFDHSEDPAWTHDPYDGWIKLEREGPPPPAQN